MKVNYSGGCETNIAMVILFVKDLFLVRCETELETAKCINILIV